MESGWAGVVISGITFLGVLVQLYKSRKQRSDDLADRASARAAADAAREAAERKAEQERYQHTLVILEQFRQIMAKLVEGLSAAKIAYKEANDVNLKMARLHEDLQKAVANAPKVVVVPTPITVVPHPPRAGDSTPSTERGQGDIMDTGGRS